VRRDFAFAFLLALAELISGDPIADSAIVILRTARHVALVAAAGGLLAACKFGPVIVGYRTITIDPAAQRVDWQNPIPAQVDSRGLTRPTLGSYYQIFTGQSGTSVEHFFQRDPATPRVKYSYLDTNMKDHLVYRSVNTREILRGPFGTVYSEKTCFFHLPIESWSNELNIHLLREFSRRASDRARRAARHRAGDPDERERDPGPARRPGVHRRGRDVWSGWACDDAVG